MRCISLGVESKEREDQATQLKKLFEEVQQVDNETQPITEKVQDDSFFEREMDVLNLPPRKEVHSRNPSRAKLKLNAPFIRFIFVVIILIGVVSGAYFVWGEDLITIINNR